MSESHRNKLSDAHKGKIISNETRQKISKSSKGISRNKGKQPMLGKKQSLYQKQKVKERFDKYYAQGNEPWTKNNQHTFEVIKKIFAKKPMNKLERFVASLLDKNNIEYHYQYFLKTKEDICKSYDFKIKNTNILLEIDGDYWHGGPGVNKHFYKLEEVKENDILKNQIATENGFSLIRIWESNIYNQPDIIIQKIQEIK